MHNSHEQDEARQPAPAELAQGRGDLALILAAGGLLGGLLVMEQQQLPSRALEVPFATLRLLLGLGYVFCALGYLLLAALFPGHTELDRSERAGLSLGLSAALAPLLALALDPTQRFAARACPAARVRVAVLSVSAHIGCRLGWGY